MSSIASRRIYEFRVPQHRYGDGPAMYRIARDSGVLELNTAYCYAAFVHHFAADGCIVVDRVNADDADKRRQVGYVQGYRPPTHRDTVFVWQIGVDASERGAGVAGKLLKHLSLRLARSSEVRYLEASVTPSNIASRKLFRGFARDIGAECSEQERYFDTHMFPESHEHEDLFRIGPFTSKQIEESLA